MSWITAVDYSIRIGGTVFRNVRDPVVYRGCSLIRVERNMKNNMLGVSLELRKENGTVLANVERNNVTLHDANGFEVINGGSRVAIVETATNAIWLDLSWATKPIEAELSCLVHLPCGAILDLHPDRLVCASIVSDFGLGRSSRINLKSSSRANVASGIQLNVRKSQPCCLMGGHIDGCYTGVEIVTHGDAS